MEEKELLLSVKDLNVKYVTKDEGTCYAVNNVSFDLHKGETLGLVGETGAGKTSIALSIMGLLPMPPAVVSKTSRIEFDGENLLKMSNRQLRKIRGEKIAMVFQDPMSALNPVDRVDQQIAEMIELHSKMSKEESIKKAWETMELVGIPMERGCEYPHQFSGGMKQRIVIAIALACNPHLIIADEPTSALDVTIQAQVLELMNELKKKIDTSMILITHDLGIVAHMCDRLAIVYCGEIVEYSTVANIFDNTLHPYTEGLFNSLPNANIGAKFLSPIPGMMPDPMLLPDGCKFASRCKYCTEECKSGQIPFTEFTAGHFTRCLHPELVERGKNNGNHT